jgi:hypothetical protein
VTRSVRVSAWHVLAVLGVTIPSGYLVTYVAVPIAHNRYFPWIVGRTLGLAAYAAMTALVALGIWVRHPWRHRWPLLHAEARLRLHAALGLATCILVGGHIASLACDRYAGVPWPGTLVPGAASYRPVAVTLGVLGCYFLLAVTATAAMAGRGRLGRHWLLVHRLAVPTLALVWLHGVLAGSDTPRLRLVYAVSGGLTALLVLSRVLARPSHAGRGLNDAEAEAARATARAATSTTAGPEPLPHRAPAAVP